MNPPKNEQEKNAKNENAAAKVGIPLVFVFSTYRTYVLQGRAQMQIVDTPAVDLNYYND